MFSCDAGCAEVGCKLDCKLDRSGGGSQDGEDGVSLAQAAAWSKAGDGRMDASAIDALWSRSDG